MGRWCPVCGAEYVEGWGQCSTCGVDLVSEPPPEPPTPSEHLETSFLEADAGDDRDPFVPIWEGPTPEGATLARRLEEELVPVNLGEAAEPGRLRIEVPRSYIPEAFGVLDATDARAGLLDVRPERVGDEDGLPADRTRPLWLTVALWAAAVILVVLLIMTTR